MFDQSVWKLWYSSLWWLEWEIKLMLATSLGPFSMQLIASLHGRPSELWVACSPNGCAGTGTTAQYVSSGRKEQMKIYTHRNTHFMSSRGRTYSIWQLKSISCKHVESVCRAEGVSVGSQPTLWCSSLTKSVCACLCVWNPTCACVWTSLFSVSLTLLQAFLWPPEAEIPLWGRKL